VEDKREIYRREFENLKRKLEDGGVWWRPQVGKNMIRILPNWRNPSDVFYKKVYVHWNVGENQRKVVCRKTLDERESCPVCEFVEELLRSSSADDVRYGEAMQQAERYAMNILDGSDLERGPQVFECGRGLFQDILWMFTDGDYGDLDDYREGRYILIERTGTGMTDTRYSTMPAANPAPVDPEAIADQLNDLDQLYMPLPVEDIVAILEGEEPGETQRRSEEQAAEELVAEEEAPPAVPPKKPSTVKAPTDSRVVTPPSEEDFKKGGATKTATKNAKPAFSKSEKVEERLRKLRKPSDVKK